MSIRGVSLGDPQKEIDQLQQRIQQVVTERDGLKEQVAKLTAQLAQVQADRPRFAIDAFATLLKTTIEGLQVTGAAPAGGVAATLQGMELEVKGYLDVQGDKAQVIVPKPGEVIDSNSLSSVKLSFGTVPVLPQARSTGPG